MGKLTVLCDAILSCENLQQLDLSANLFECFCVDIKTSTENTDRWQILCETIARCKNLQQLYLKANVGGFQTKSFNQILGTALKRCPQLQIYDIRQNTCGTDFLPGHMIKMDTVDQPFQETVKIRKAEIMQQNGSKIWTTLLCWQRIRNEQQMTVQQHAVKAKEEQGLATIGILPTLPVCVMTEIFKDADLELEPHNDKWRVKAALFYIRY